MNKFSVRKNLMTTLSRYRLLLFVTGIITLAVIGISLLPPQLLRLFIDRCLQKGLTKQLLLFALLYPACYLLQGFLDFLKNRLLSTLGEHVLKELRHSLWSKLHRLPSSYFTKHSAGEISSFFTNDVENVGVLISGGVVSMFIDCMKILGIVASMAYFSLTLGAIALLLIPIIFLISGYFRRRMERAQTKNLEQLAIVNTHISETMENAIMIKAFGRENYLEGLYKRHLQKNYQTIERVNFYDSIYSPVIQLLRGFVVAGIVLLTAQHLPAFGITIGMVAASIDFISNLFSPIDELGMELQNIQKGISGMKRIDAFFEHEEQPPKDNSLTSEVLLSTSSVPVLSFENLSFSYGDGDILSGLELTINSGEIITFAGRTGVGKSTLFRLIMGLLVPTEGDIYLNGYSVSKIPNTEKRRLFGYVEQSFSFIPGTIAEQISLRDPQISRSQIANALQFVGLGETIAAFPEGMDTVINPSVDFSQGQKQLLSIARAIVLDPPILLLDEVTAYLDSATEEAVVACLLNAGQNRTILSISHRLTSMLHCDRVITLTAPTSLPPE